MNQNPPNPNNPKLPDGTWAVTKEDKKQIVDFGRALTAFVFAYIAEKGFNTFHAKIVAGGFQYFMDIQAQKAKLIGDDVVVSEKVSKEYALGDFINEPFIDPVVELEEEEDVPPTPEEEKVSDPEVDGASIAPSSTPIGAEMPVAEGE